MKTKALKSGMGLLVINFLLLIFSCAQAEKEYDYISENITVEKTGETAELNALEKDDKKNVVTNKIKIIKNANCKIKVLDVEQATILAKKMAFQYDGYISDERFTNTNYTKENRFTLRIPQISFDKVLDSICLIGTFVDHKSITTVDVTEEYVDITSRLKIKLEVKQRYEDILRSKAKTVEDILMAESKLREIQEEIEAAQGRLNYLTNKISYSTIQVDMYETIIPKEEPKGYTPSFLDKAVDGVSFGWKLVEYFFLALFYCWPLLILVILILLYFRWIKK
ncbi:DUF4349 domain-containing protein [Aquimarina sp. RZ0]|uniref:DUF4349 domain-containing protein n=1 Tax=Aquimarina sp. RZ0 TaxID=2607730 RepID=UPI0011F38D0D|nr:DUF4349 domain-containing protein [Aquimarina sp. RZ0]KAA1244802.1 DUF4349 domain-containing protein [Aquimarina sp. RZ0]